MKRGAAAGGHARDEGARLTSGVNPPPRYGTVGTPLTSPAALPATPQVLPLMSNATPMHKSSGGGAVVNMSFHRLEPSQHDTDVANMLETRSWWDSTCDVSYTAAPSCVTVMLWYAIQILSTAAVGNYLGAEELAQSSIAYYSFCFIALYPGMGMTFAVDTICSQAFGRDPSSTKQGEACQRSLFVSAVLLVPMTVLLLNTESICGAVYRADFAVGVATWHRWSILYLATQLFYASLSKYLNNQLKQHLATISLAVSATAVYPLSVYFVAKCEMGIAGAPLAMGVASLLQLLVTAALITRDAEASARWGPWLSVADLCRWEDLKLFLTLGAPSVVFVAAEAGAFDFLVLFSATFGDVSAAAWSTVQSMLLLSQSTSAALSVASSTLVGQAVGCSNKTMAARYTVVAPTLAGLCSALASIAVVLYHRQIFWNVTVEPNVEAVIAQLVWIIPCYHVLDCVQFVFQGIFSGCGRNHTGSKVLMFALWGVGFPLTLYCARWGLAWSVAGFVTGLAVEIPLFVLVILRSFDWEPLSDE